MAGAPTSYGITVRLILSPSLPAALAWMTPAASSVSDLPPPALVVGHVARVPGPDERLGDDVGAHGDGVVAGLPTDRASVGVQSKPRTISSASGAIPVTTPFVPSPATCPATWVPWLPLDRGRCRCRRSPSPRCRRRSRCRRRRSRCRQSRRGWSRCGRRGRVGRVDAGVEHGHDHSRRRCNRVAPTPAGAPMATTSPRTLASGFGPEASPAGRPGQGQARRRSSRDPRSGCGPPPVMAQTERMPGSALPCASITSGLAASARPLMPHSTRTLRTPSASAASSGAHAAPGCCLARGSACRKMTFGRGAPVRFKPAHPLGEPHPGVRELFHHHDDRHEARRGPRGSAPVSRSGPILSAYGGAPGRKNHDDQQPQSRATFESSSLGPPGILCRARGSSRIPASVDEGVDVRTNRWTWPSRPPRTCRLAMVARIDCDRVSPRRVRRRSTGACHAQL